MIDKPPAPMTKWCHPPGIDMPIRHLRQLVRTWEALERATADTISQPAARWTHAIEAADRAGEWWCNAYPPSTQPWGTALLRDIVLAWTRDRLAGGWQPYTTYTTTPATISQIRHALHAQQPEPT